jgi:DNA-binding response OmpR family regulator
MAKRDPPAGAPKSRRPGRVPDAPGRPIAVLLLVPFPPLARSLAQGLREEGFRVVTVSAGTESRLPAEEAACDVIVLDGPRHLEDARDLLVAWKGQGLHAPVLLLTDPESDGGAPSGDLPAERLDKPFALEDLFARLRRLARDCRDPGQ